MRSLQILAGLFLLLLLLSPCAAAGADFNGDGFDDMVVGVPYEDLPGAVDAGEVNVLYGSSGGVQAKGTGGPVDQVWNQDSIEVKGTAEANDAFGCSLTWGDFNGDGFDDLAIGVCLEDVGTISDAGAVSVIYGSASGLQADGTGGPEDQLWSQDSTSVSGTPETGDLFGSALCGGDFDGDGYADLAIGVNHESSTSGDVRSGAVNVLYGSPNGLQADGPTIGGVTYHDDQIWSQDSSGVKNTAESEDEFGYAVSCGDYNGDGYHDLAIGVRGEDGFSGAVNVIYGSPVGLQSTGVTIGGIGYPDDEFWQQGGTVKDTAELFDYFGSSLSSGDYDGDGHDDLAIGVPGEDVTVSGSKVTDAGAVTVLYGSRVGLNTILSPDDDFWSQGTTTDDVEDVGETEDAFGFSLASGDFNGDGKADLAIGVPYEDVSVYTGAGAVNVLYGSATGLQATGTGGPDDELWTQNTGTVADTCEANDGFGLALGGGDFDGDGFGDLAIGVHQESIGSIGAVLNGGGVHVLYGYSATAGLQDTDNQFWSQNSSGVEDTSETNDFFGTSMME